MRMMNIVLQCYWFFFAVTFGFTVPYVSGLTVTDGVFPGYVVAQDGTGDYTTVKEAVDEIDKISESWGRFVIYVKMGVYSENVEIYRSNVTLVGDGIGKTIITANKSSANGSSTYASATFAVDGSGFMARGITFRNTAGVGNGQAVAVRCSSDFAVFYHCSFEGYQDTLYYHSDHQFYRECDIYGTADFIFGFGAVVFQNCNIFVRNPSPGNTNTITADGRRDDGENRVGGGACFHKCTVTAAPDLKGSEASVRTYLGRPWSNYSTTVFMESFLDSLIDPAGWSAWMAVAPLNTLYYGEYMNYGPGASTAQRVNWAGYHVINDPAEASKFTVGEFIDGDSWLPSTDVPFISGLS